MAYSISNDVWSTSPANAPGEVFYGGSLVQSNSADTLYAFQGDSTDNFWAYSISADTWDTTPADPPALIGQGGDLVYPDSGDTIYAFQGELSDKFWGYSISKNTWTPLEVAPETVHIGGALVYPGSGDLIYAFGGNIIDDFTETPSYWTYSIANKTWDTSVRNAPDSVARGASLVGDTEFAPTREIGIFAFKGGGNADFWKYRPNRTPFISPSIPDQTAPSNSDPLTLDLAFLAGDTDGDDMKWSIANGADTLVTSTLTDTGFDPLGSDTLTLSPTGDTGSSAITMALGDGRDTTTQAVGVTIVPNQPPTIDTFPADQTIQGESTSVSLSLTASDTEGNSMRWNIRNPADTIVNSSLASGTFTSTGEDTLALTSTATGLSAITLSVTDGSDSSSQSVNVNVSSGFSNQLGDGSSVDTTVSSSDTTVGVTTGDVTADTKNSFTAVTVNNDTTSENPLMEATSDSSDRTSRDVRFVFPLLAEGQDTLTVDVWTTQTPFSVLYALRSDTESFTEQGGTVFDRDRGTFEKSLPVGIPTTDTGLQAFGRTAFLLEFADSEGRLLGSDTTTTDVSDTFSYVAEYNLSETTTRLYHSIGLDTSAGSDSFAFNFADRFVADWQADTVDVNVEANSRGGIIVRVAVLGKDLPGSLGGSSTGSTGGSSGSAVSSTSGGAGGGGCLIERSAAPESTIQPLREVRDWMLESTVGRTVTKWYYRW